MRDFWPLRGSTSSSRIGRLGTTCSRLPTPYAIQPVAFFSLNSRVLCVGFGNDEVGYGVLFLQCREVKVDIACFRWCYIKLHTLHIYFFFQFERVFEMMLGMVMFFGEGKVNICMFFMTMMQVLVLYQIAYIAWVWVVEGRFRPTLASLFMYSSRGLLGYSTQLPVPQVFRSPPSLPPSPKCIRSSHGLGLASPSVQYPLSL